MAGLTIIRDSTDNNNQVIIHILDDLAHSIYARGLVDRFHEGIVSPMILIANPPVRTTLCWAGRVYIETNNGLFLGTLAGYFINKFRCDKP